MLFAVLLNCTRCNSNAAAASTLLGSMTFLTTVVISLVNLVSKPDRKTRVTPKFFLRDFGFLLLVVLYELALLLFVGHIDIWWSLGFLVLYAIFVTTVIITNNQEKGKKS